MNIVMMTNTYTPFVGGVTRSVQSFTEAYRRLGHRVLVVAPEFNNMPEDEVGVVRIPAIQNFNSSDFSVILPVFGPLAAILDDFAPDIVHAHHPFLLGGVALRIASRRDLPLVFTNHTMYERYTHYVPGHSKTLQRLAVRLSTSYANVCDQVLAPSESVAAILRERGVKMPIDVVPTGVNLESFRHGSGEGFRAALDIPGDAFVVGHVGRLAPEKNLPFLAQTVSTFLSARSNAIFLVVGSGPSETLIRKTFAQAGLEGRLRMTGSLGSRLLTSAYKAMDVFAFASQTETQGMVLAEAMAAGVPVVAVDAPGSREVVADNVNGRLLPREDVVAFAEALAWVAALPAERKHGLRQAALAVAAGLSIERCAEKTVGLYERARSRHREKRPEGDELWSGTLRLIRAEWGVLKGMTGGNVPDVPLTDHPHEPY